MSEQLYYTYSTIGSGSTTGERIRAQSLGVGLVSSEPVRAFMKYLTYRLPAGADLRTPVEVAPLSLVLAKTQHNDRILSHKKYVDRDGIGRAGNFFTHAIINPQVVSEQTGVIEPISAHAAISLWKSPLWKTSEDQAPPKDTRIDSLSPQEIHKYTNTMWEGKLSTMSVQQRYPHCHQELQQVADCLPLIFSAFLMLKKLNKKQLYIAAPADMVASLIWCITRCLPKALTIMQELTFSTYEYEIAKSTTTITGTCWLPPANHSGPFTPQIDLPHSCYQDQPNLAINCYTQRQTPFEINEQVGNFVQFATQSLLQNDMRQLDQLIRQAERKKYQNFEDLLAPFRIQQEEATKDMVQDILGNPQRWSHLQYTNIQDKLIELIRNIQDTDWVNWWKAQGSLQIKGMRKLALEQPQSEEAAALSAFADRVMMELYHQLATDQQESNEWAMYWDKLLKDISNPSTDLVIWTTLPQRLSKLLYTKTYQSWWQQSGRSLAQELYQMTNKNYLVEEHQQLAIALNHWWQPCAEHLRETWAQGQGTETSFWLDILSTIHPPMKEDQHWNLLLKDLDRTLPRGESPINWCGWDVYKRLLIAWLHTPDQNYKMPKRWYDVYWPDLPQVANLTLEQVNDCLEETLYSLIAPPQNVYVWLIKNYLTLFRVQTINPNNKRITSERRKRIHFILDTLDILAKKNETVLASLRPSISCWCTIRDFFSQPVFDPDTLRMIHDHIKAVELSEVIRQELHQEMLHFLSTHVQTNVDIHTVIEKCGDLLFQAPPSDLPAHALLLKEMVSLQGKFSPNHKRTNAYIRAVLRETINLSESGIAQEKQTQFVDECLGSLLAYIQISYIPTAQWPPEFISLWESYLSRNTTARSTGTTKATAPVSSPVQYHPDPANSTMYNQDNLSSPLSTVNQQQQITVSGPSPKKLQRFAKRLNPWSRFHSTVLHIFSGSRLPRTTVLPPRPIPHTSQRSMPPPPINPKISSA